MDDDAKNVVFVVTVLGIGIVAFACWAIGYGRGESTTREEAIKVGVARWVADAEGKPKFEWIVPLEKKQ